MRKQMPTGAEIAKKAGAIKLNKNEYVQGKKNGKSIKFTAAHPDPINSMDELEDGQVIGVLENEIEGDESGLPQGKHNLFLTNVNGAWQVYAESGGKLTGKAARVSINKHHFGEIKSEKPKFHPDGWCLSICWISIFGWCILGFWICF